MHWRSTKPPGCGGFFIGMVHPPSVVIDVIDVEYVAVGKAKNYPPIGAYRDRPKALKIALRRMKPETRHIHIGERSGGVESHKNIAQL
jgi:hypothetical protein